MKEENSRKLKLKQERFLPGPRIINCYRIEGTLTTKTPLHVGSGEVQKTQGKEGEELPLLLVMKDHQGRPMIPGSSLRGALRGWLEANLAPFNSPGSYDVASFSCGEFDFQKGLTPARLEEVRKGILGEVNKDSSLKTEAERHEAIETRMTAYYLEHLDLVAGLFGHGRFHSRVDFENAVLEVGQNDDPLVRMPGVSIDPVTGAARKGHLFAVEAVKPGRQFQVSLQFRNVHEWEIGMVLAALEALSDPDFPLRLGGHEGTDYGRVEWNISSVRSFGSQEGPLDGKAMLAAWMRWCVPSQASPAGATGSTDAKAFRDRCLKDLSTRLKELVSSGPAAEGAGPEGKSGGEAGHA